MSACQSPLSHNSLLKNDHSNDTSSLSVASNYWNQLNCEKLTNNNSSNSDYYSPNSTQLLETNYLLDNFAKLGKSSLCLDQGYHTLVSSNTAQGNTNLWTDGNLYKGKKNISRNNSFDRLPDELVLKVFSFLTSSELSICAQVCRRFDILVWTPSLWQVIILDDSSISGDKAIKCVLRQLCGQGRTGACPSVEKIVITNGVKLSDKILVLLARRCPELTHLQLQGCTNLTNNALFEVCTRCTNLQHLDVSGKFI